MSFALTLILGILFYLIFGGLTLKFALMVVSNYSPPIGTCMVYQLVVGLANGASGALMGFLFQGFSDSYVAAFLIYGVSFLISAVTLNFMVNDPETGKIGILKAVLVLILQAVIGFVICFVPLFFLVGGVSLFSATG